jgi:hypothetical protein
MARKKKLLSSAGRAVVSAGIGGGGYLGQKLASENVEMLRDKWWALPAASFVVAALLGTRSGKLAQQVSSSLATVAGYTAVMAYQLQAAGSDTGAVFHPMTGSDARQEVIPVPEPMLLPEPAPETAAVHYAPSRAYSRPAFGVAG